MLILSDVASSAIVLLSTNAVDLRRTAVRCSYRRECISPTIEDFSPNPSIAEGMKRGRANRRVTHLPDCRSKRIDRSFRFARGETAEEFEDDFDRSVNKGRDASGVTK